MTNRTLHFALSFLLFSLALWGCANQGSPEGGPYDTEPPRLISAHPQPRATGVKERRFVLRFDEYVKLSSEQDKIIVSHAQIQPPRITANGKSVVIILEDSLRQHTTYSFYFGDAIQDNNEDNPLEDFGYLISTGDHIDSMQISGQIVDALTYEPIADLLVGAHTASTLTDSTLRRELFPYVSRTNRMGRFTLRGLPDTTYRVFALKDNDRNYKYNERSEGLAFDHTDYRTTLRDSVRTDTIRIDSIVRRDTLHRDSLVSYPYTFYYPDNISLRYSVPVVERQGLERHSRPDSLICRLEFLTEPRRIPRLRSLDRPHTADSLLYWATARGRAVDYWLRDPALIAQDSVRFAVTYQRTDSLFRIEERTDTLTFLRPKVRERKKGKEEKKSPLQLTFSGAKGLMAGTPGDSLILTVTRPLVALPQETIHLEVTRDSTTTKHPFTLQQDSLDRLRYQLLFARGYGDKYQVKIDSAALRDLYGVASDSVVFTQATEAEAELGHLTVTLHGVKEHALVELLDKGDLVLATQLAHPITASTAAKKGTDTLATPRPEEDPMLQGLIQQQKQRAKGDSLPSSPRGSMSPPLPDSLAKRDTLPTKAVETCQVTFRDLKPGEYYLRLILDEDANGAFTPGDYPSRDPEPVYYCPQTSTIKKGFTSEEKWEVYATSPFLSKPEALRKVKPDEAKKKREDKNIEYYKRWGRKK